MPSGTEDFQTDPVTEGAIGETVSLDLMGLVPEINTRRHVLRKLLSPDVSMYRVPEQVLLNVLVFMI